MNRQEVDLFIAHQNRIEELILEAIETAMWQKSPHHEKDETPEGRGYIDGWHEAGLALSEIIKERKDQNSLRLRGY